MGGWGGGGGIEKIFKKEKVHRHETQYGDWAFQ